jgi:Initiator Replication protein
MSHDLRPMLPKSTGIVEIAEPEGRLQLSDRRLFNHLLAHAYPELGKIQRYSIPVVAIRRFAAEAREGVEEADNRRIKESITRLQKTLVQFNYMDSLKGDVWESSQLLGSARLNSRTGILEYTFPDGLAERLLEPALYSYISLRVMYRFESKYALILYEILKRYADRNSAEPYWAVKSSQLRDLLGCRDRLANWKDFRNNALNPAVAEINELAEFTVDVSESRQGRGRGGGKVVGVTFSIRRKAPEEAAQAAKELDKPRVQRRGERKARQEDVALKVDFDLALRFLTDAEPTVRLKWQRRAEELGAALPRAAIAPENLGKWIGVIAPLVVAEENLGAG